MLDDWRPLDKLCLQELWNAAVRLDCAYYFIAGHPEAAYRGSAIAGAADRPTVRSGRAT